MAWDFDTDPQFQELLDWADDFVRDEVEPLDLIWPHLQFTPARRHPPRRGGSPQGTGTPEGAVGHPSRTGFGWAGIRTAETRSAERDPGPLAMGAGHLRLPGTRYGQRRDHRALRHPPEQKERYLRPLLDGRSSPVTR